MLTLPYRVALMITLDNVHPVAAWRSYYGISRKLLAEHVGISEYEVADIEKSNKHLKQETLCKLANLFGIKPESLNIRYHHDRLS